MNFFKNGTIKIEEPFLIVKPNKKFVGRSRISRVTEKSGVHDDRGFDGKNILVSTMNMYMFPNMFYLGSLQNMKL